MENFKHFSKFSKFRPAGRRSKFQNDIFKMDEVIKYLPTLEEEEKKKKEKKKKNVKIMSEYTSIQKFNVRSC